MAPDVLTSGVVSGNFCHLGPKDHPVRTAILDLERHGLLGRKYECAHMARRRGDGQVEHRSGGHSAYRSVPVVRLACAPFD